VEITITGAGGFLGSHMAAFLLAQGHQVHAISHREPEMPFRRKIWEACTTRTISDLRWKMPVLNHCDRFIHFAANMGGVGFFTAHDYKPFVDNSRMTFNVLEAVQLWEVERSFLAASACLYPTQYQMTPGCAPKLDESMIELGFPDQMYGREKLMMTRLAERHPQDVRVGILHTVYGPGQEYEGERVKFPMAAARKAIEARTTKQVVMWGDGEQKRSYLFVDDAVRKIWAILEGDYDGPVNVGMEGAVTCNQIQQLSLTLAGVDDAEILHSHASPTGVVGRDCDNAKFNRLYGDLTEVGYSEGFAQIIDWLDENGTH
jgi:GDP-D-mannose 3',5'-epimerase